MAIDPLSLDFGREKRFCVYVYFDPRPRKKRAPIYVGKGITKRRPDEHWKFRAANTLLKNVLEKIRKSALEPIVEFVGFFDDHDAALALEKALIAKFGRRNNGTGTLCNFTDGGVGTVGTVVSDETKRRLSVSHRGNRPTQQTLARMSEAQTRVWLDPDKRARRTAGLKGHRMPPEARAKIGAKNAIALLGKTLPEEVRVKLSAGLRERWARLTPDQRSAIAKKGWDNRSPESKAALLDAGLKFNKGGNRNPVSDETRAKMSESAKRRLPPSPETRARLSEGTRKAWAEGRLGRRASR